MKDSKNGNRQSAAGQESYNGDLYMTRPSKDPNPKPPRGWRRNWFYGHYLVVGFALYAGEHPGDGR